MHAHRNPQVGGVQHQLMRTQRATTHTNTVMRVIGRSLILLHLTLTALTALEAQEAQEAQETQEVDHLTQLSLEMTVLL